MVHFIKLARIIFALTLLTNATAKAAAPLVMPPSSAAENTRPKSTLEKTFSSWGLSCATAQSPEGKQVERCMISQMVTNAPKTGKVLLGVTVDYADSNATPTMRFRFAPGAKQKAGVGIKIDNGPEMRLAINSCNEQRCEAVGRLPADVLKLWRNGKLAQLAFIEQGGKQLLLPISLEGFNEALSALRRYLDKKK